MGGENQDDVKTAEQVYDEEWAKLEQAEQKGDPEKEEPETKEEPEVVPEKKEEPAQKQADETPEQKAENLEKRLADTQKWGHDLSKENAELKRLNEELKKGKATQAEVDAQQKAVEDMAATIKAKVEGVKEDYPELVEVFDTLIETTKKLAGEVTSLKKNSAEDAETRKHNEALQQFNTHVKPEILKEHPDYDAVLGITADGTVDKAKMGEYVEWANKQRPALKFAALDSGNAEDIKWAMTEYKKFKGTPEAKKRAEEQKETKKQKITDAEGVLRGGSTGFPSKGGKEVDPQDYDAGWEAAGKLLEKQGIK